MVNCEDCMYRPSLCNLKSVNNSRSGCRNYDPVMGKEKYDYNKSVDSVHKFIKSYLQEMEDFEITCSHEESFIKGEREALNMFKRVFDTNFPKKGE